MTRIDNARFFLDEYHVDGFRYDEVSVIDRFGGWHFCQDLTGTVKYHRPSSLHHAEFWNDQQYWAVRSREEDGAGFDTVYGQPNDTPATTVPGAIRTPF